MSFETLIAERFGDAMGSDIVLGLVIFFAFNIFVVVSRVPSPVIIISNGILLYMFAYLGLMNFSWAYAVAILVTTVFAYLSYKKLFKRDF